MTGVCVKDIKINVKSRNLQQNINVYCTMRDGLTDPVSCLLDALYKGKLSHKKSTIFLQKKQRKSKIDNCPFIYKHNSNFHTFTTKKLEYGTQ